MSNDNARRKLIHKERSTVDFLPLYAVMLGLLYLKPHITVVMEATEMEEILWNETFLESFSVYYASKNVFS